MAQHEQDILVVDDDEGVRSALRRALTLDGFAVRESADGAGALEEIERRPPSVVLLDVTMPGLSGLEVTRRVRSLGIEVPICMLSGRDDVDDRVAGLAAGADDYVVKPFSTAELSARLHALVRLHRRRGDASLVVGDVVVDARRGTATRAGRDLGLTRRELDLLTTLAEHPGQVLSRAQLLEHVWGYDWDVDSNVVDVFVGYLRRKLEADGSPRLLHTARGLGFVLRP